MRQRVRRAIQGSSNAPRPPPSRKLREPEGIKLEARRLRLERWRVVYVVDEEWSEVGVLAIRKRPPYNYKNLPNLLAGLD